MLTISESIHYFKTPIFKITGNESVILSNNTLIQLLKYGLLQTYGPINRKKPILPVPLHIVYFKYLMSLHKTAKFDFFTSYIVVFTLFLKACYNININLLSLIFGYLLQPDKNNLLENWILKSKNNLTTFTELEAFFELDILNPKFSIVNSKILTFLNELLRFQDFDKNGVPKHLLLTVNSFSDGNKTVKLNLNKKTSTNITYFNYFDFKFEYIKELNPLSEHSNDYKQIKFFTDIKQHLLLKLAYKTYKAIITNNLDKLPALKVKNLELHGQRITFTYGFKSNKTEQRFTIFTSGKISYGTWDYNSLYFKPENWKELFYTYKKLKNSIKFTEGKHIDSILNWWGINLPTNLYRIEKGPIELVDMFGNLFTREPSHIMCYVTRSQKRFLMSLSKDLTFNRLKNTLIEKIC